MDYLRSGVQDQPSKHNKTLSLLKIQKLAGHGDKHPLLGRLRQENHLKLGGEGCSEPRSHHCTSAGDGVSSVSKKKNFFFVEIGSQYVAQVSLELVGSRDPSALAF